MNSLEEKILTIKQKLDIEGLKVQVKKIEEQSAKPDFWQNHQRASEMMKQMAALQREIGELENLDMLMAGGKLKEAARQLEKLESRTYFSGRYDYCRAIFSVHAGQGGTEAMDWAQMLKRMYIRYFEKKNWRYEIVDEVMGEEAGIKSTTILVMERYAYGYLRFEAGTHRLVRQSPFNADHLRQTSFALIEVLPQPEETTRMDIKDDDLEWQFFRSSTQGGQNVQKVSTAVRLHHKPTGTTVTCQTQRYQEQNRKIALELLQAKLWGLKEKERQAEEAKLKQGRTKAAWGTQIRSYVLHPYRMVKDLRTGFETADTEAVLGGDLDGFVQAELSQLS